jgi:hypothetical protein
MDIDVDKIPVFLREYKNKPITKNIRFLTEQQLDLIEIIKKNPGYNKRFLLPLKVIKHQKYAIIEEKGENIIPFLETNEKQRDNLVISMFQYLSDSSSLVPNLAWNIENIIVYEGRPLLDVLSVTEDGVSLDELYKQIRTYFSTVDGKCPVSNDGDDVPPS